MNRISLAPAALIVGAAFAAAIPASAADIVATAAPQTVVTMLNDRDLMIQTADASAAVQLHFAGTDRIEFGDAGELLVMKSSGGRARYRPDVYQMIDGKFKRVIVSYKLDGGNRVTMRFGKFDSSAPVYVRRGAATM